MPLQIMARRSLYRALDRARDARDEIEEAAERQRRVIEDQDG